MTDTFTLADIDTVVDDPGLEPEHLEFELRYRDGTSSTDRAYTDDGFDRGLDFIVKREIELRLAQPRSPECQDIRGFTSPEWISDIEDTWNDYDDECRCSGACFCYVDPHSVVDPQRQDAIFALTGCTEPATIATWRWSRGGTGGTDTIYTTGRGRQGFDELWYSLPSAIDEDELEDEA